MEWVAISFSNQLSGWTEKKLQSPSQSKTCPEKRSWSLFSDLLFIRSTTAFWIAAKPLHLRNMLRKLQCLQTALVNRKGLILLHDVWPHVTSKVEQIGLRSFASSATWPLADRLPLLQASWQLFCRENASTIFRRQKMLSKRSLNTEAWIFMVQE